MRSARLESNVYLSSLAVRAHWYHYTFFCYCLIEYHPHSKNKTIIYGWGHCYCGKKHTHFSAVQGWENRTVVRAHSTQFFSALPTDQICWDGFLGSSQIILRHCFLFSFITLPRYSQEEKWTRERESEKKWEEERERLIMCLACKGEIVPTDKKHICWFLASLVQKHPDRWE